MEQLPKQIEGMSKPIYIRLLAELADSLGEKIVTLGEEKDEDDDD